MISTRLPIPSARPFNGVLRAAARPMPNFRFNPFDEDDVVSKASQIPWKGFHLVLPKDDPPATVSISQSTLSRDLAELARITIIGGKPQRAWPARPKHGVIGDHLIGQETSWPHPIVRVSKKIEAPATETNENAGVVIFAPKPIVPLGPVHAAFEVRANAGTLGKAELTPLSATFADENVPLTEATQNDLDASSYKNAENAIEGPVIPTPRERGDRQPFGVLHDDEEATPPRNRIAPFVEVSSPPTSESGSNVSSGNRNAKGWARLRPKAPPVIKITSFVEMS